MHLTWSADLTSWSCKVSRHDGQTMYVFMQDSGSWCVLWLCFLLPCLGAPGRKVPGFAHWASIVPASHQFHLQNGHHPNSRVLYRFTFPYWHDEPTRPGYMNQRPASKQNCKGKRLRSNAFRVGNLVLCDVDVWNRTLNLFKSNALANLLQPSPTPAPATYFATCRNLQVIPTALVRVVVELIVTISRIVTTSYN